MINLKYFNPSIDREGLMKSYDEDVLQMFKKKFSITDAWVTYSWGFSDAHEQEGYDFLRQSLPHFKNSGIATHAYVQGTNLVYADHHATDYWCRDLYGRTIPYHRGRLLCCPNNPAFRRLLLARIEDACQLDTTGVYVDNFHFGQFPVPLGEYLSFFGCHCQFCKTEFHDAFGKDLPRTFPVHSEDTEHYINFRTERLMELASDIRAITNRYGKQFGTNSFDPSLRTQLFYGTDLSSLSRLQDYLMFEDYHHPSAHKSHVHLKPLIDASPVPVFCTSYKKAIGKHAAFSQIDLDAVASESRQLGYFPCFKATEFTTNGIWHNMDPRQYHPVSDVPLPMVPGKKSTSFVSLPFSGILSYFISRFGTPFLKGLYEHRLQRRAFGWIIDAMTTR
jgi:hypothetical protein